ncbi:hypothetical protein [Streptomyces sp. NPDC045470]
MRTGAARPVTRPAEAASVRRRVCRPREDTVHLGDAVPAASS